MSFKEKLIRLNQLQIDGRHKRPIDMTQEDYPVHFCKNCETEFRGNYCPNCGQKSNTERLSIRTAILQSVGSIVSMERGFVRTALELFYRPGYLMRDYIEGKRADYHKPFSMLFVLATLHIVVHYIFYGNSGFQSSGFETDVNEAAELGPLVEAIMSFANYMVNNQALSTLLFILILIVPNWLVFKMTSYGKNLNLAEHFYIMLFVGCQLLLFNIFMIPYNRFFNEEESLMVFVSGYSLMFGIWDFSQLYQIKKRKSLCLFCLTSLLALIIFILLISLVIVIYIKFHPESITVFTD